MVSSTSTSTTATSAHRSASTASSTWAPPSARTASRHSSDFLDQQFDLAVGDDGLQVSGQAGIDWGPLPFASGDLAVDDDGDITFEGVVQGTIPTPVGLLSGRAEADFVRDGDTWAASVDADGTLVLAGGGVVKGGVEAAYAEPRPMVQH